MAGWLEKWGLKLISTQVVVEVGVELGNIVKLSSSGLRREGVKSSSHHF